MILGISSYYHDSAAVLLDDDGGISAAVQEERFTRIRHTAYFPTQSILWCLKKQGCALCDVNAIVFYENPPMKVARLLDTFLCAANDHRKSFEDAMPLWLSENAYMHSKIINELKKLGDYKNIGQRLFVLPHHSAHAASAFYPSPWKEALIVTVDGVGEYATCTVSIGQSSSLIPLREIRFPHSLGLVYSAFTYFCGFKVNSGEYKLMGLAPYGKPVYAKRIKEKLLKTNPDGSFRVASRFFGEFADDLMITPALDEILDGPPLLQGNSPSMREANIAASIQVVIEDALINLIGSQIAKHGIPYICMAGGVALNCVANARILRELPIKGLWVQPAAGDAGGALGAALFHHHSVLKNPRSANGISDSMKGALLGPEFKPSEMSAALDELGAVYEKLDRQTLVERCAKLIADGASLAWFQGAMEYGPRALGSRSILADPRSPTIQRELNLKIKKRESFRPFAPAVLKELANQWFDLKSENPYMLLTAPVVESRRRAEPTCTVDGNRLRAGEAHSEIPAVTHIDYSARVQTVDKDINPFFHALISKFFELTGCPMLLNTSFNIRGEPIVCTPTDAFICFMNTDIEYLAVGNFFMAKDKQDTLVALRCVRIFDPD